MKSYHRTTIPFFVILSLFLFVLQCSKQKKEGVPVDFTLDTIGGKFHFHNGNGKLRLVYFGFLSCPDVCPTTFQTISASLKSLSAKEQSEIEAIYIDVDPERDTLPNIKKYLDYFGNNMIPLTGSSEELNKVASIFNAKFSKVPIESDLKYTIDHTTSVYLVDREGNYKEKIPYGIPVEAFVGYLKKNL
jgi:protein SCO1/2